MKTHASSSPPRVELGSLFSSFFRIGALLFGGGYAMLPLLEREVVQRRAWCDQHEMADYYAMAQLVPGVIGINTAMLVGHRLRGLAGSLAATAGIATAPFCVILAYAALFDRWGDARLLAYAMAGLRPAVAGLMLGIAWSLFRRSRQTRLGLSVSLLVPILVLGFGVSAARIIVAGLAAGWVWHLAATAGLRSQPPSDPAEYSALPP